MKPPKLSPAWPYFLLLLATLVFFWDSFFAHKVLCLRDPSYFLFSFPQFVSKALKTNEFFPLWNPFIGHGKPYIADPEAAFFYPGNWLLYLLRPCRALAASYAGNVLIAGASLYALARHWKLDVFPALCAAISLMFSTWLLAMVEFRALTSTFIWGPLEWLVVSSLIERARNPETAGLARNFWRIAALAVLLSLQYLAGYPQMLLYTQGLIGLFIAARCYWLRDLKTFWTMGLNLAIAGGITAGICMVQFLPSWEFIGFSERGIAVDPGLNMASLHPRQLSMLLFPYLFGHPGYPQEYWGETIFEFWIGICYVGIFPLIAATFSPFCLKGPTGEKGSELHRFLFFFFCAIAGLGLVLAAGKYTPIYMALYDYVPGFNHFRWPSKFLLFVLYALCILSAMGLQQLLNWRKEGTRPPKAAGGVLLGWLIVLLVVGIGFVLAGPGLFGALTGGRYISTPAHDAATLADFGRGVGFLLAGLIVVVALFFKRIEARAAGGIAIAVTFANLWLVSREVQPIMDDDIYELTPKTLHAPFERMQPWQIYSVNADSGQFFYGNHNRALYQWAKDAAINDVLQPYGLFQEHTVGLKLRRYIELYSLLPRLAPALSNRLADVMNIRYVVKSERMENVLWNNGSREVEVLDRPSALAKAYVVDRWRLAPDFQTAVRTVLSPAFDPHKEVVLEPLHGQPPQLLPSRTGADAPGEVRRLHYQWNSVDLSVTAARESLLVLTDTWFPGWKATVNGQPTPIYQANGYFRAVLLPKGDNEVVFTYRPWQFSVGLTITLTTLSLLGLAGAIQGGLYAWRSRKR